jgi:hypothetical protein
MKHATAEDYKRNIHFVARQNAKHLLNKLRYNDKNTLPES